MNIETGPSPQEIGENNIDNLREQADNMIAETTEHLSSLPPEDKAQEIMRMRKAVENTGVPPNLPEQNIIVECVRTQMK